MHNEVFIAIAEAIVVYSLVLWAHSLRNRFGLAHFYALLGCLAALISLVIDAEVETGPERTLMASSAAFYAALVLGIFVVYVFDGPYATQNAIFTITGVSIVTLPVGLVLHKQGKLTLSAQTVNSLMHSLRIVSAFVFAMVVSLIFLAIAWEILGKSRLRVPLWIRSFLTLLGVMWLNVALFATGAFLGSPAYLQIVAGMLASRLILSVFAYPFLYLYLARQNGKYGMVIEHRPVLSILKDGPGWRLQKAAISDPSLPRVLLMGDSILSGYLPGVTRALEGKACIDAWITLTSQGDKSLPRLIEKVLAQGPYDVIHFNLGLHGWQKGRIPEGQYEQLTHAMVQAFKRRAPAAVLIWASTTPVTPQDRPGELDPEINPVIVEHNAMAAKVMEAEGVPIDDLNVLMMAHLDLASGDRFHWRPEGNALMVKQVSETLSEALNR